MHQESYFSHKRSETEKHPWFQHAEGTARRAEQFASVFQAGPFAQNAGWYHDVGHCSLAFQRRLFQNGPKIDHTSSGAYELWKKQRPLEAICVAGSHAGLLDYGTPYAPQPNTLCGRLDKVQRGQVPKYWLNPQLASKLQAVDYPEIVRSDAIAQHFFLRFLFSCVVDAGWLDTEAFMRGTEREQMPSMSQLFQQWTQWLTTQSTEDIHACQSLQEEGRRKPGCYLLKAPAGTKTVLQSIAFALQHAVTHQKTRLIYVVPHTASIEPVVQQFQTIFGKERILGAHTETTMQEPEESQWNNADNWDIPLIVTTPALLFESIYGNQGPKCRKVHNLANAVLILEEPNRLPEAVWTPCAIALQQLVTQFQTTLLLRAVHGFQMPGLPTPTPLTVEDTTKHSQPVLTWMNDCTWEQVYNQFDTHTTMLCIVNHTETVTQIYEQLKDQLSIICITEQLTPRHQKQQRNRIQEGLRTQTPMLICATPVIESFEALPISKIYREQTGLDAIQHTMDWGGDQAHIHVFSLDSHIPDRREQAALTVRRQQPDGSFDTWMSAYFETWIQAIQTANTPERSLTDQQHTKFHMERGNFATLGTKFHINPASQITLYIPNEENKEQLKALCQEEHTRPDQQDLQADALQISKAQCESFAEQLIKIPNTNSVILTDLTQYHPVLGLLIPDRSGDKQ